MELQNNNHKFISYIILLLAFFILIFFTRSIFSTLQQQLDDTSNSKEELIKVEKELQELNELKRNFASNQDELLKNVSKYTVELDSEKLFNYVYSYVDNVNSGGKDSIIMKTLSFSEGSIGDLGLYEGKINITARFSSHKTLMAFLNYLIKQDSQYTFFIDEFSYPNFGKLGASQVNIPLKMYYKK